MASAIAGGLIKAKRFRAEEIACCCGPDTTGPDLSKKLGIRYMEDGVSMVSEAETVVVACKPQQLRELSAGLEEASRDKLVLSVLAGTPISKLSTRFGNSRAIVRSMPNTPGQIGAGVTGYSCHESLSSTDEKMVTDILKALGDVVRVPEADLDAITAVSGSGPAYVFEFTVALMKAGIKAGLKPEVAELLAKRTVLGSAKLMNEVSETPEELRDQVTSKGGTTEAALASMATDDFTGAIERAVKAAAERSVELSKL